MPLLLAALALIAGLYLVLRVDARARHACRTELLNSQKAVASDLQSLLDMNKQAKGLRREREIADQAAKSRHPLALAYQGVVIAKQTVFRAKQLFHFGRGKARSLLDPQRTFHKVRSTASSLTREQSDHSDAFNFSGHSTAASFDVVTTPSDSLTPDYNPSPAFERKQVMRVTWRFPAASAAPEWLRSYLKTEGAEAEGSCAVTLEKRGLQWFPKITL